VNSTILALNRVIGGWCRYYQYASQASVTFTQGDYFTFWRMAHWLGRKYDLSIPAVIRRFRRGNSFATTAYRLIKVSDFPSQTYRHHFLKPNPYTTQERIVREELPHDPNWTGYECRPGMTDLRPLVLQRDNGVCQRCGVHVTPAAAVIDHRRLVRRFRRPVDANRVENLQTLCIPCHRAKTESDQRAESPAQGNCAPCHALQELPPQVAGVQG
jgi:5-methylcytosine-specific restriction endonuclease McrA